MLTVMATLIGLPASVYFLLYDHQNEPLCHKGVMLALLNWLDQKQTDVLPNVEGRSVDSLGQLHAYWGDDPWEEKYRYIPGLHKGDPGDLVMMYMPVPTRYIWHDNPQTVFAEPKWMIVPLDFCGPIGSQIGSLTPRDIPAPGEESERVSLDEFKTRLKKTLDFLRSNDRPNWQTAVAEHTRFLDSLANGRR
jgi:hypothetical protein